MFLFYCTLFDAGDVNRSRSFFVCVLPPTVTASLAQYRGKC